MRLLFHCCICGSLYLEKHNQNPFLLPGSRQSGATRQVTFRAEIGNVKDAEPRVRVGVRVCLKWLRKMTHIFFSWSKPLQAGFQQSLAANAGRGGAFSWWSDAVRCGDSQPPVCSGSRFRGAGAPQLRSIVIRAHPHAALPLITCTEWLDAPALTNCLSSTLQHNAAEQHVNRREMDGWMDVELCRRMIYLDVFWVFFYKRSPRDASHPSTFTGGKTWVT